MNSMNQPELATFLSMCALFDEVCQKCITITRRMIIECEQEESETETANNIGRLSDKRGQMIQFLEGLQIRVLEYGKKDWISERDAQICGQRLDHFNRGVIRWSLEMENLESLLQAHLKKLQDSTKAELTEAFTKSKKHKGYDLNNVR